MSKKNKSWKIHKKCLDKITNFNWKIFDDEELFKTLPEEEQEFPSDVLECEKCFYRIFANDYRWKVLFKNWFSEWKYTKYSIKFLLRITEFEDYV